MQYFSKLRFHGIIRNTATSSLGAHSCPGPSASLSVAQRLCSRPLRLIVTIRWEFKFYLISRTCARLPFPRNDVTRKIFATSEGSPNETTFSTKISDSASNSLFYPWLLHGTNLCFCSLGTSDRICYWLASIVCDVSNTTFRITFLLICYPLLSSNG